jgi:hypothetical protein
VEPYKSNESEGSDSQIPPNPQDPQDSYSGGLNVPRPKDHSKPALNTRYANPRYTADVYV